MRLKRTLLALLLIFSACRLEAAGIKALMAKYIEVIENRMALQPLLVSGREVEARYRELHATENALAPQLRRIFHGGDDIAEVAMGFLAEAEVGEALLYFRDLIPTDSPSPAAKKLLQLMKAIETRRRQGELTSSKPEGTGVPGFSLVGPLGAPLLARPDFRARVTALAPAGSRLRISARSGTFARCSDGAGREGYIFLGLLSPDDPHPTPDHQTGEATSSPSTDIPPNLANFQKINDQKPTYYVTTREEGFPTSGPLFGHSYDGSERKSIKTPAGAVIAETSGRYFASLCMEGSGVIKDGRTVSFVSDQRFQVAPAGCLGITATGYWVVPFHTLAVNRNQLPYRGVYFVPGTRGLKLPNGEVHDGYWFAHDTGSAFTSTTNRLDMYVDRDDYWKWMEANFVPSFTPVKFYRVDADTKAKVYAKYQAVLGKR